MENLKKESNSFYPKDWWSESAKEEYDRLTKELEENREMWNFFKENSGSNSINENQKEMKTIKNIFLEKVRNLINQKSKHLINQKVKELIIKEKLELNLGEEEGWQERLYEEEEGERESKFNCFLLAFNAGYKDKKNGEKILEEIDEIIGVSRYQYICSRLESLEREVEKEDELVLEMIKRRFEREGITEIEEEGWLSANREKKRRKLGKIEDVWTRLNQEEEQKRSKKAIFEKKIDDIRNKIWEIKNEVGKNLAKEIRDIKKEKDLVRRNELERIRKMLSDRDRCEAIFNKQKDTFFIKQETILQNTRKELESYCRIILNKEEINTILGEFEKQLGIFITNDLENRKISAISGRTENNDKAWENRKLFNEIAEYLKKKVDEILQREEWENPLLIQKYYDI